MSKQTIWLKWECDHGARWTSVKGSPFNDHHDGDECNFSGCAKGHKIHFRGETESGDKSHYWFRRPTHKAA